MKKLLLTLILLFPVSAKAEIPNLTTEQSVFIEDYKKAAKERDPELYWQMIHPEVRSCMSEAYREYITMDFMEDADQFERLDTGRVSIETIELDELRKDVAFNYRDRAFVSIEPNYALRSEIVTEAPESGVCGITTSTYQFNVHVAFYDGAWFEVVPCGRDDLKPYMEKQVASRKYQKKRVETLYDTVPMSVWDDLAPVLTQERDTDKAARQLEKIQGISLTEAKALIGKRCDVLVEKERK